MLQQRRCRNPSGSRTRPTDFFYSHLAARRLIHLIDIPAVRRALFELYLDIVSSPTLRRPWALPVKSLKPFDRQAYVTALLDQHNHLPEAPRILILEWPECASFGCMWLGLPRPEIDDY